MTGYFTQLPELEAFVLDTADTSKRRYRKELLYAGDFLMHDGKGERFKVQVDEALLDHFVDTNKRMREAGVEVPLPLGHTDNAEKRRGTVIELVKGVNKKGLPAVFSIVEFRDAEAEKLKSSQVSAYIPPKFVDGKGNTYYRPVTHVALTDYPVIPGLEGFETVAASLLTSEERDMSLRNLAEKLGLTGDEARDDVAIETSVLAKIKGFNDELKTLRAEVVALKKAPPAAEEKSVVQPIAAGFLSMARDNRMAKIDKLVAEGKITPAVSTKLQARWCADEALTLSLSATAAGTTNDDGFDNLIESLSANEKVMSLGGSTGGQTHKGTLPNGGAGADQAKIDESWGRVLKNA